MKFSLRSFAKSLFERQSSRPEIEPRRHLNSVAARANVAERIRGYWDLIDERTYPGPLKREAMLAIGRDAVHLPLLESVYHLRNVAARSSPDMEQITVPPFMKRVSEIPEAEDRVAALLNAYLFTRRTDNLLLREIVSGVEKYADQLPPSLRRTIYTEALERAGVGDRLYMLADRKLEELAGTSVTAHHAPRPPIGREHPAIFKSWAAKPVPA